MSTFQALPEICVVTQRQQLEFTTKLLSATRRLFTDSADRRSDCTNAQSDLGSTLSDKEDIAI